MKKQIMEPKNIETKGIIEMCQGNNYWNIVSFSRYMLFVVFVFEIVISYSFTSHSKNYFIFNFIHNFMFFKKAQFYNFQGLQNISSLLCIILML